MTSVIERSLRSQLDPVISDIYTLSKNKKQEMEVIPPLVKDGKVRLVKEIKFIGECIYYPITKMLIIRFIDSEFLMIYDVERSAFERQGYSAYNIGLK